MEIIADMGNNKMMVSISVTELAIIMGYNSDIDISKTWVAVGRKIDIDSYKHISNYVKTMNTKQLGAIKIRIDAILSELEKAINLADELQVFDKLKDGS